MWKFIILRALEWIGLAYPAACNSLQSPLQFYMSKQTCRICLASFEPIIGYVLERFLRLVKSIYQFAVEFCIAYLYTHDFTGRQCIDIHFAYYIDAVLKTYGPVQGVGLTSAHPGPFSINWLDR